jgi:hypothetical protein
MQIQPMDQNEKPPEYPSPPEFGQYETVYGQPPQYPQDLQPQPGQQLFMQNVFVIHTC